MGTPQPVLQEWCAKMWSCFVFVFVFFFFFLFFPCFGLVRYVGCLSRRLVSRTRQ